MKAHPGREEEVEVLVEQRLVLGVVSTEVLQEAMGQLHDLIHLLITLRRENRSGEQEGSSIKSQTTESSSSTVGDTISMCTTCVCVRCHP